MARASMHTQRVAAEQKWTETASRKSQYKGVTHQRDLRTFENRAGDRTARNATSHLPQWARAAHLAV